MNLESADGDYFSFAIEGYEFPDEALGPTEDNPADQDFDTGRFLIVSCVFRNSEGEWSESFPEMDTTGLAHFIRWMESISNNVVIQEGVHFIEYGLEFSIDASHTVLHVHTFHHFLPPWTTSGSVTLNFPIAGINFSDALASLRQMADQFPGRPPLGDAG